MYVEVGRYSVGLVQAFWIELVVLCLVGSFSSLVRTHGVCDVLSKKIGRYVVNIQKYFSFKTFLFLVKRQIGRHYTFIGLPN